MVRVEVDCRYRIGPRPTPPAVVSPTDPLACRATRSGRGVAPLRDADPRLRIIFTDTDGVQREATIRAPSASAADVKVEYGDLRRAEPPFRTHSQTCEPKPITPPTVLPGRACTVREPSGAIRTWFVQMVKKQVPDFGGDPDTRPPSIYVSTWLGSPDTADRPSWANAGAPPTVATYDLPPLGPQTFDGFPQLLAYPRWSKFSPGGYQGYLAGRHFPVLFGSLTYSGYGVYGPGDRNGSPTTDYGRNVYIDTLDSDYGSGWRRIMGVLTQPPNGTFCYELSRKGGSRGKTGISATGTYRLTAIGPGLTPVVQVEVIGPTFAFGAPDYDPRTMKWGTGFSAEQAQALRDQAAMIGPRYRTKPKGKGSTDCGATLRQLPEAFFAPPPA
jgi:hypothetical protein